MSTIATWTIQIFTSSEEKLPEDSVGYMQDKRVLANLPAMLEAVEEDLTSLLPEGYRCIIKEALP